MADRAGPARARRLQPGREKAARLAFHPERRTELNVLEALLGFGEIAAGEDEAFRLYIS